ncbi:glycoside hydrolase family 79 protein [Paxillus rubicundulus Ve08.2h10]|uniref:Glycoside hydrolase family 79 protein n=1 Tax=Paxillus rubicundulus Ve08.2h10 TaxID=930991 RepID=A0A0D0DV53_9AGAM|nr:glycoside hydrolase family 79 protein [Paxillus rubicundulus Ve08.2h10]
MTLTPQQDLESLDQTGTLDMADAAWAGLKESFHPLKTSQYRYPYHRADRASSTVRNEPDQCSLQLDAQSYTAIWEPRFVVISKALNVPYPKLEPRRSIHCGYTTPPSLTVLVRLLLVLTTGIP